MKYIVYKTTNKINNYIYIGVHKTVNPNVFDNYLGCGCYADQPSTYNKAKTKFQQAVQQYGPKNFHREIIAAYDNEDEAYLLEEQLVNEDFLQRDDVYNMVLGGVNTDFNGILVFRYTLDGVYDKSYRSYEDAARDLQVQASSVRRSAIFKVKLKDYYFNTDKMDKIDTSLYNHVNSKKIVYRYLKTGEFDKTYQSQADAAEDFNVAAATVLRAIQMGVLVKNTYYYSTVKCDSYDRARTLYIKTRKVYKYSSDGEFIAEYETQQEAEKDNPYSNITKAIKLKSVDENGFIWGLVKLKNYNKKANRAKRVAKLDSEGNILQIWKSGKACCKEVGNSVQNVLSGKGKTHKGFVYKYID